MRISDRNYLVSAVAISIALWVGGCDSTPTGGGDRHAPYSPHAQNPTNRADGQPTALTLRWSSGDPDSDPLTFRLRFGNSRDMALIDTVQSDSIFHLSFLAPNETYYWQVIATDTTGRSSSSAQWRFSTWNHFVYPLVLGDGWRYHGDVYYDNFSPDSLQDRYGMHTTSTNTCTVSVPFNCDSNFAPFLEYYEQRIETTLAVVDRTDTLWQANYLQNHEDGLYNYGYSGSGFTGATPKLAIPQTSYRLGKLSFRTSGELVQLLCGSGVASERTASRQNSTGVADTLQGLRILAYPLVVGSEWVYRGWIGDGAIIKTIVGREQVSVPAGTFNCFKIRWSYRDVFGNPAVSNLEFYDFISDVGLVKRSIHITGIEIVSEEYPEGIGTADFTQEYVLTERFHTLPLDPGDIIPVR